MQAGLYLSWSDEILMAPTGQPVRLVLNAATGRVHALGADYCEALGEGNLDGLPGEALAALERAGLVVADGVDQPGGIVAENASAARRARRRTFVIVPAAEQRCGYCGQIHEVTTMSRDCLDRIVERIETAASSGYFREVALRWMGTEPLAAHYDILRLAVRARAACAKAGVPYRASLVTGLAGLTPRRVRELWEQAGVSHIDLCYDAGASPDDGSPATAAAELARLVAEVAGGQPEGPTVAVRVNVPEAGGQEAGAFARAMAAAGLDTADRVWFTTAVVAVPGAAPEAAGGGLTPAALTDLTWLRAFLGHGLQTVVVPSRRRNVTCAATDRHAEVVGPDGTLTTCTAQLPGMDDGVGALCSLGELAPGQARPSGRFDSFGRGPETSPSSCPTCPIFPICGGACPLAWGSGRAPCPTVKQTLATRLTLHGLTAGFRRAAEGEVQSEASEPDEQPDQGAARVAA